LSFISVRARTVVLSRQQNTPRLSEVVVGGAIEAPESRGFLRRIAELHFGCHQTFTHYLDFKISGPEIWRLG